ncbi:hypothetical protein [Roseomonas chloroacetimidivorans]|uniref:hypothetical protein n=1 Tax=Roseomonas chloroacetimidivorans TaxID=1766656 RepID=UPI003C777F7D
MTDRVQDQAPREEMVLVEPWPQSGPDYNSWNLDAARFVALVQAHPTLWHNDSPLKYLGMRIDTRDGAFILTDRDGNALDANRVIAAIRKSAERYGSDSVGAGPRHPSRTPTPSAAVAQAGASSGEAMREAGIPQSVVRDLMKRAGYDDSRPHPDCYTHFSWITFSKLLFAVRAILGNERPPPERATPQRITPRSSMTELDARERAIEDGFLKKGNNPLAPPAPVETASAGVVEAWEMLDAHVQNRRDMGQFGMADQMEQALSVIRTALTAAQPAPVEMAGTGVAEAARAVVHAWQYTETDPDGPLNSAMKRLQAALAAAQSASGGRLEEQLASVEAELKAADARGRHARGLQARLHNKAIALRTALTAAQPASGGEDWQPIETAPKGDGRFNTPRIQLWAPTLFGGMVVTGRFSDDGHSRKPRPYWGYEGQDISTARAAPPTHWRPLPAPPAALTPGSQS